MSQKSTIEKKSEEEQEEVKVKRCFVIMPISDHPDYEAGHFDRVYEELIKPAVVEAGFVPVRADDVKQTHIIILEILKSIVDYDMAICDMSSLNPNVLYELGIRQMNKKPVVLIKDEKTRRIFDTGLMSDTEYASSLRIDKVKVAIQKIASSLEDTYANFGNRANSLIDLLGIDVQIKKDTVEVTKGENLLMGRMNSLERLINNTFQPNNANAQFVRSLPKNVYIDLRGKLVNLGDVVKLKVISNSKDEYRYYAISTIANDGKQIMAWNLDTAMLEPFFFIIGNRFSGEVIDIDINNLPSDFTPDQIKNIKFLANQSQINLQNISL